MDRIFNLDGPVWGFFSKLGSAFLLSILWTVTSLPVITIGASNAAIYYVMLKIFDEKDVKVVREYFKAFKENFKRATLIWIPLLLIILVGLVDVYICMLIGGYLGFVGAILFLCAEIVLVLFMIYVFPLVGRFENTLKQTVKNGLLMPIKHYFVTLWIMLVIAGVVALGFVFPPVTLFLPGVMAFAISWPLYYVFQKYTPEETDPIEAKVANKKDNTNSYNVKSNLGEKGKKTKSKKDRVF
ncbi:MAG: DUF624 domain-containing protein [Lachnospiraceae bacterium]|nr:DUF624 domain-containing protein [Lachnospiraceae bacterium]